MRRHRGSVWLLLVAMLGAGCSSSHHPLGTAARAASSATGIAAPAPTSGTGIAAPTTSVTGTAAQCPATAAPATGMAPPPSGLVSVTIYQAGRVPFTDSAVSGVDLLIGWDKLEPEQGTYDWPILDCVFQQADTHGKLSYLR